MRKSLCFFWWGVLCIFTWLPGKAMGVSGANTSFAYSDSLQKAVVKETIYPKKHRAIAALLAFPLGVLGLHRAYLGTSYKVPLVYILTAGGGGGVLPFFDFVLIILSRDIHKTYVGNHHLFMWQKTKKKL